MAVTKARDIGIEVTPPPGTCTDPHCPFHGTLSVRGVIVDGLVASTKMEHSVVVEREFRRYVPKYERYEKRTRRYTAHHPPCIPLTAGDEVTIMECRPISKTKSFVVIEARKGKVKVVGEDATAAGRETATSAGAPAAGPAAAPAKAGRTTAPRAATGSTRSRKEAGQ
ncbi:MAG: 30S ribosomal protein S17 [Thermoplasmatota archaeon]